MISGRLLASRMNLTAPSTARVPDTEYSTRLIRPGAICASFSTSGRAASLFSQPLICMPWRSQAWAMASRTEGGVGP